MAPVSGFYKRFSSLLVIFIMLLAFSSSVYAAADITLTKRLSWDVVGLDSNDETSGPDTFAVGYRYCNNGSDPAMNVVATFYWDSVNTYINLETGTTNSISLPQLDAGTCYDFYFNVQITRDDLARQTTRKYHIGVKADGITEVNTPIDATNYNEIYVEDLISQNRNLIHSITGPQIVERGGVYEYVLDAKTATQGYEQLETFIDFPNTIFRVLSVDATYSVGGTNDAIYADACGWVHDPEDPNYFTNGTNNACTTSDKSGGDIIIRYQVEILGTGTADVSALIYDFSGSSFHYNSDYGFEVLSITAVEPNLPPIANDDFGINSGVASPSNPTTLLNVGANDTDSDGSVDITTIDLDPSIAGIQTTFTSSDGTWVVNGSGDVTFTPNAGFTGTNTTITYTINDDDGATSNSANLTVIYASPTPGITIVKTASVGGTGAVGDTVTYTFTISNTGNAPLTNVTVTDPLPGLTIIGGPIAILAAGTTDSTTISGTYTITQTDVDNGSVTNQATVTGTPPIGSDVTDLSDDNSPLEDDPTVTELTQTPGIALVKTASIGGTGALGDTITYTFTVSNTGNVSLRGVNVDDATIGVTNLAVGDGILAVGETKTATAIYTITQTDIDNGSVTNQATATGTPPSGSDVTDLSDDNSTLEDDPTVTYVAQTRGIAIVKTGSVGGTGAIGDTITYTFAITNIGNVPLTNVTVTDPLPGLTIIGGPITTLAAGATDSTTISGTYTITQTDVNNGSVTNQATVTGIPPSGSDVTDLSDDNSILEDDPTVTSVTPTPGIAIVKTASVGGTGAVGDTVTYTFTISNTGNVPLTNVTVTDPLPGLTIIGGPIAILTAGATDSTTIRGIYTIIQDDVDTGSIINQATVTGTPPSGSDVTDLSDDNSISENEPTVTALTQTTGFPIATDNLNIPITEYRPTVIDVLANGDDWGSNGPGTQVITFTQPIYGTVDIDDGGTPNDPTDDVLIYTPAPDINNVTDSFTYTITDALGFTSTATVTLNINCATSQRSDSGDALGTVSMLVLALMTLMIGLHFVRKEEERGEA